MRFKFGLIVCGMKTRLGKREAFCRKDCIHDMFVRRRDSIAFDVKIRKDLNRICSDIIIINLIKTIVKTMFCTQF